MQEESSAAKIQGGLSTATDEQERGRKFQARQFGGRPSDGFEDVPLHSPNSSLLESSANGTIARPGTQKG